MGGGIGGKLVLGGAVLGVGGGATVQVVYIIQTLCYRYYDYIRLHVVSIEVTFV